GGAALQSTLMAAVGSPATERSNNPAPGACRMRVRSVMWMGIRVLCLLLPAGACAAVEAIVLAPHQAQVALAPATRYMVDLAEQASAEKQFLRVDSDVFQPLLDADATFGFVDGAYWFHTRLVN